jgi:hypothetical protein
VSERFRDAAEFFIETIELPPELGTVACGLYGPTMGDAPVPSMDATMRVRGTRAHASRTVARPTRQTNRVTIIAGPHGGDPCVLYTAFGGPLAPKEVDDPTLADEARPASIEFWADHALAVEVAP